MGTRVRLLPHDEWNRLAEIGPFKDAQVLPDPLFASVIVLENEAGEIIGCWMTTPIMLLEGLWLREDQRGNRRSGRELLQGMLQFLQEYQVKTAITVIQEPEIEVIAKKTKFEAVPGGGRLYTVMVPPRDVDSEEG